MTRKPKKGVPCLIRPYGFDWGPAKVTRLFSDESLGVWLEVETPRKRMQIRVTPSGLIRVGAVEGVK